MNRYEQRQADRKARLERAADRAGQEASQAFASADAISRRFEGGQPILVGHHSERKARRDQDRMHGAMDRGVAADRRAKELSARAASVGGGGISSDDPDAVAKLRAREAELVAELERAKALRKAMRGWRQAGQYATEAETAAILQDLRDRCESVAATKAEISRMASCLRAGQEAVPAYMVSNPRENLRRVQERIAQLEAKVGAVYPEPISGFLERELGDRSALLAQRSPDIEATNGYRIECDAEENRVTVRFEHRVPVDVVRALKSYGFRWCGRAGDWRRMLSPAAWYFAQRAVRIEQGDVKPFRVEGGEAHAEA